MSTRLSNLSKGNVENVLTKQLREGIRFIDCPLTDEEQVALWDKLIPEDVVNAVNVLDAHGYHNEYHLRDRAVEFHLQTDETSFFKVRMYDHTQRRFLQVGQKDALNAVRLVIPDGRMNIQHPRLFTTGPGLGAMIGFDRATAFMDWAVTCDLMKRDIESAIETVRELFEMIKTAGQLKRMVPDLFRYIPDAQRAAFDDQKRASTLPFEWAGYDRARVERMLGTLLKCQLLTGSAKPRMAATEIHGNDYSWAEKLVNAQILVSEQPNAVD